MRKILNHRLFAASSSIALGLLGALPSCGNDAGPPIGLGGDPSTSSGGWAGEPSGAGGGDAEAGARGFGGDPAVLPGARCESFLPEPTEKSASENCGCLGVDERWSCSIDTCLESDGTVRTLEPESGFLQIPAREFVSHGVAERSLAHRIFYSFHPADELPAEKPLLVFFNGGPGSATMPYLFAQNTAPKTLIAEGTEEHGVEPNPVSYTRAFNLLYLDAPHAGFSYSTDGSAPFLHQPDRDAGIFIEVVLGFLERHPSLERAPVGFVGESYGGTRAILMSERLLHYPELIDAEVRTNDSPNSSSVYFDPGLYEVVQAHFARTRPELGGAELTPDQVSEQFGRQILIQPGLPTRTQTSASAICEGENCAAMAAGPCTHEDWHDCSEPTTLWDQYDEEILPKLEKPDPLSVALGVDAESIEWLRWCRPEGNERPDTLSLVPRAPLMGGEPIHLRDRMFLSFARSVQYQRILMTNARLDLAVRTPIFWAALHEVFQHNSARVRILADEPRGAERPGRVEFQISQGELRSIRFPSYAAGHMVPHKAAAELYDDIVAFWDDE